MKEVYLPNMQLEPVPVYSTVNFSVLNGFTSRQLFQPCMINLRDQTYF